MDYTYINTQEQFTASAANDKAVAFDCQLSTYFMQHMMMGGFDQNMQPMLHIYIAPAESLGVMEILAYYTQDLAIDREALNGKKLRVYGTLRSQKSQEHTEYGLYMDKVEVLD